jgi:hypothetical protein
MPESTRQLCAVCSDPADPEVAHWLHEPECPKSHGPADPDDLCGCDVVAHPECCPELDCQDIGNGHTIELTAQFTIPPWFTPDQVAELARDLCEHVAQPDKPFHAGFGPDPDDGYSAYDIPYICAAQAETLVATEDAFAIALVVWGHGDRCRSCHHIDSDHTDDTGHCGVDGCDCPRYLPYGRLAEIGEARP